MRRRGWVTLGRLGAVAAAFGALVAVPGAVTASAASQIASDSFACVLAPGVLNVQGSATLTAASASAPSFVAPGGSASFTQVSVTLTVPANWSTAEASLGATTITGSMTNLPVDASNATPATADLTAPLSLGPTTIASNQPATLTFTGDASSGYGPFTASPTADGQSLDLTLDTTPGFTGSAGTAKATGNGIVMSVSGLDASGNLVAGPLPVVCNPPANTVIASVPISTTPPPTTTTTTTTTTTSTPPPTTTTTTTTTTTLVPPAGSWACVLAPGILNEVGTLPSTVSISAPSFVPPGGTASFTQASATLTIPASWGLSFSALGATSISGSMTSLPVDATNATPAFADLNAPLSFGPVGVASGPAALTFANPSSGYGPFTASATADGQSLVLSLDPSPGFVGGPGGGSIGTTGNGVVWNVSGFTSDGSLVVGPLTVVCNPAPSTQVASVPITNTPPTTTTTTPVTTTTTPPTTTTTTTPPVTTTTTPPTTTTTTPPPPGYRVITANVDLACTLAPGVLNVRGTVAATLTGTVPQAVSPGDTFTIQDVTASLTTPAVWSTSFASLGASTAQGAVTNFVLDGVGTNPTTVNAASPPLTYGPAPIVTGQPLTLSIPNTGPYPVGPFTVTGVGSNVTLSLDPTANGIVANATGLDSSGNPVVGPLTIDCTAPAGSTLGSVPIEAGTTTTTSTASTATVGPTTTRTTSTSTSTSTSTTSTGLSVKFVNWTLSGSLTDHRLGQKINLPAGSTFNGAATIPGPLTGTVKVPNFTATIKILGIPTQVGLSFTQVGSIAGTIAPSTTTAGNLVIAGAAKANIGINAVGILGLKIPVSCTTSSPVSFGLNANLPALDLTTGATFAGTTTLPSVRCGGLLGGLLGPILSALFSGPNNPYSLTIAPPASSASAS